MIDGILRPPMARMSLLLRQPTARPRRVLGREGHQKVFQRFDNSETVEWAVSSFRTNHGVPASQDRKWPYKPRLLRVDDYSAVPNGLFSIPRIFRRRRGSKLGMLVFVDTLGRAMTIDAPLGMDRDAAATEPVRREWPKGLLTRIPYWVYQDEEIHAAEQRLIYEGPVWNYLCLEAEIARPGDYRVVSLGSMPVVVARDFDDEIYAFENRCAHRGALIALDQGGHARDFTCVYHAWNYDLKGNLKAVAFEEGVSGKGGMGKGFCRSDHGPRKLRITHFAGLVFGSLSDDVPPIGEYLGDEIAARIKRVLCKPVVVTGRFSQILPHNWKLYFENVKDTYHASLLHAFFTTFRINRLTQRGGLAVSPNGGNHVSFSYMDERAAGDEYSALGLRADKEDFALRDSSLLTSVNEFNDHGSAQILTVFPGFVLQQIQNALAIRHLVPQGISRCALNWTYFGFADDTPELRTLRYKHDNLAGPAGYVSMEDGCVGGFVRRGITAAVGERAIVEMGGSGTAGEGTRATEAAVRGFWKCYRDHLGI
jgi:anthranilate 1,2-dioxygenase large subunit/terephthalate 1,2-dioxygenase oxygenase component alpha subunit